jgi:hypothetical protein
MKLSNHKRWLFSVALLAVFSIEVFARVGGGHSYGGGSGGGGGGDGGDGGALVWILFQVFRLLIYLTIEVPVIGIPLDIIVIVGVVYFFVRRGKTAAAGIDVFSSTPSTVSTQFDQCRPVETVAREFAQLRKFDPNFSEIVFTDFAYALYGKAHEARGRGVAALDEFSPYLSGPARNSLLQRNQRGLAEVKGIIVGSMQVTGVDGLDAPVVRIGLVFEANYTEVTNGSETAFYVRERWELERKRDRLSLPPEKATALHCPRCGAPLQKDSVGACAYCHTKIDNGEFQWYVRSITLLSSEDRGPLLTSDVPEVGTDLPSVVQPNFSVISAAFERDTPQFSWHGFQERARLIFNELQSAWSSLDWERARPHETDNIFQMHQYWIDAYKRQGLRNAVDQLAIVAMQPIKIQEDAFYHAITVRIWAQGHDYTIDQSGRVVSGSRDRLRSWSEYWTFIRNKSAKPADAQVNLNCPNCGAPLKVNASGICEFCGGKITSGEFDWVLSKIEQDEAYRG